MIKKNILYFLLSLSFVNYCLGSNQYSSEQLDQFSEKFELQKAVANKKYYGLPTPEDFDVFQTETPLEMGKSGPLADWLKDFNQFENELERLIDYEDNRRRTFEQEESINFEKIIEKEPFERIAVKPKAVNTFKKSINPTV